MAGRTEEGKLTASGIAKSLGRTKSWIGRRRSENRRRLWAGKVRTRPRGVLMHVLRPEPPFVVRGRFEEPCAILVISLVEAIDFVAGNGDSADGRPMASIPPAPALADDLRNVNGVHRGTCGMVGASHRGHTPANQGAADGMRPDAYYLVDIVLRRRQNPRGSIEYSANSAGNSFGFAVSAGYAACGCGCRPTTRRSAGVPGILLSFLLQ